MSLIVNPFAARRLWTPDEIECDMWFDAADEDSITESGGAVSQWDDKSGKANHLTQGTEADKPTSGTRTLNGLNVIDFDGANDELDISSPIDMIGKEIWIVARIDSMPLNRPVFMGGGGNNQTASLDGAKMRIWQSANPYSADSKLVTLATGTDYILGFLAHNNVKKFSKDGSLTTTTDSYVSGSLTPTLVASGQYDDLDGYIAEIIVCPQRGRAAQQIIEGYLAWKWGLEASLPGGHPYEDEPPLAAPTCEFGIVDMSGTNPHTGEPWRQGDKYRIAFAGSGAYYATSTDIADYNDEIQDLADVSDLGLGRKVWKCIGSTSTVDAKDNVDANPASDDDGPVYNTAGELIASSLSALWGTLPSSNRIDFDEDGNARPKDTPIWTTWGCVWTGTGTDGTKDSKPLGNSSGTDVTLGLMAAEAQFWLKRSSNNASTNLGILYGMSEVLEARGG